MSLTCSDCGKEIEFREAYVLADYDVPFCLACADEARADWDKEAIEEIKEFYGRVNCGGECDGN